MLLHDRSDLAKVVAHAHRAPLKSYHQDGKCEISKRRSKVRFRTIKKELIKRLIFARSVERYIYTHVQFGHPIYRSVAAPGWLRRETGGYDYPL